MTCCSPEIRGKLGRFLIQWILFGFYIFFCSLMFKYLESEEQKTREIERNLARNKTLVLLTSIERFDEENLEDILGLANLIVEGKRDLEWDLVNSLYYSSSLYTTVGYGDMVCRTDGGKMFTIFFIVTSVPMWFSTLAQLGYFLHLILFKCWSAVRSFCCNNKVHGCCSLPSTPPLAFLAFLTVLGLGLMTGLLSIMEGKSYFESLYFAIVTFSTVGLGDEVPQHTFAKLRCLFVTFTLGFALLSSWVSNVADIIYTRHFDPTLEQDIERKLSMDQVVNPEAERHLRMQRRIPPQFFLRSHTQRVKHQRKISKLRLAARSGPSTNEPLSDSTIQVMEQIMLMRSSMKNQHRKSSDKDDFDSRSHSNESEIIVDSQSGFSQVVLRKSSKTKMTK